jgi:hypothetical protein
MGKQDFVNVRKGITFGPQWATRDYTIGSTFATTASYSTVITSGVTTAMPVNTPPGFVPAERVHSTLLNPEAVALAKALNAGVKPNTGVLAGMACPKCSSQGPFYFEVLSEFKLWDNGTWKHSRPWDFDAQTPVRCDCGHSGIAADFGEGGGK